eukprot:m.235460 g.235460  ORF g.235460 m.235460 type:complete len:763 (-) comp12828_c0_seq1:115-2403(-)
MSEGRRPSVFDALSGEQPPQPGAALPRIEEEFHYHPASRSALDTDVSAQPWFRSDYTRKSSEEYLANSPPGAFVVREASTKDCHILDVQAGGRVCHVQLLHVLVNKLKYYKLPGTPHMFEHLMDLVLFCHYNPFHFNYEGMSKEGITLSLAMARRAEQMHVKKIKNKKEAPKPPKNEKEAKKQEAEAKKLEEEEAKVAEQEKIEWEKERELERAAIKAAALEEEKRQAELAAQRKAEQAAAEAKRLEEVAAERARRASAAEEARLAAKAAEAEAARKAEEENERRQQQEAEARRQRLLAEEEAKRAQELAAAAARKAELDAQKATDSEAQKKRAEEADRARQAAHEESARLHQLSVQQQIERRKQEEEQRKAEEAARQELEGKMRRRSEALIDAARKQQEEQAARVAADRARAEAEAARLAELARKQEEERLRQEEERQREQLGRMEKSRASKGSASDILANIRAQFVSSKRPMHLKKVKTEYAHPYELHVCPRCPGGACPEGFKFNKFKPSKCSNCYHIHELRDDAKAKIKEEAEETAVPAAAPAAPAQTAFGKRFYPNSGGKKISELVNQLTNTGVSEPAPVVKKDKKKEKKAKGDEKKHRRTEDLRSKVSVNPEFVLEMPEGELDPFKDPYLLMPADEPFDENLTALRARCELVLGMVASTLASGHPSRQDLEQSIAQVNELESLVQVESRQLEQASTNDDSILQDISRTNPEAYKSLIAERDAARLESDQNIKEITVHIEDMRQRLSKFYRRDVGASS